MKSSKTSICYFLLAIAVMLGISAESYAAGSISGTVTNTSSQNVSDAIVTAFLDGNDIDTDITDSNGTYSIGGLDADTYEIHVVADNYEYRIETDVVVADGEDTTKNVTNLASEGVITGTVTKSDEITAIADALVKAKHSSGLTRSAMTDANGDYTIDKLPAGTYTVKGSKSDYGFPNSENPEVTSGQTTSNVDLIGVSGKISGTVTESGGSPAIEGADVWAEDSNDDVKAFDITDSSGDYELVGLATGSYTVVAQRSEGAIAKATSVSVTDGSTTDQDFSAAGGSISGTVTNSSQTAIQGAVLTAAKDGEAYTDVSDSSGDYSIEGLTAGLYMLTVDPNNNDYVASKIDDVNVVSGQDTSDQDFTLGADGKISGTITDTSPSAIEGATVLAIELNDANDDPNVAFIATTTNASGNYTVAHLRSGTYTIYVCVDGYVSDSETGVSVTAGQTTSNKNFSLGTSGGTISGTVYKSDAQTPIEGAFVECYSNDKSWSYTTSDSSGDYSLTLLQAGTYKVQASADGYDMEILSNVVVTGTQENSDNDFTLDEE